MKHCARHAVRGEISRHYVQNVWDTSGSSAFEIAKNKVKCNNMAGHYGRTCPILSKNYEALACLFSHTAIPYRASTGPEQDFPCIVNSHKEKPVFITGNPCSHCRDPVLITGNSLWELLHREIPVVITGNGFAVVVFLLLFFVFLLLLSPTFSFWWIFTLIYKPF